MKAVIYEKFSQAPTIQNIPDPSPDNDGVVIKVKANGKYWVAMVCRHIDMKPCGNDQNR